MQRLEDATLLAPRRRGLSQARQAAERRREGKGEGKKHQCMVASYVSPTGDLVYNPGMCPDWESNQLPFGLQASAQSTEPHQPGLTTPLYQVRERTDLQNHTIINLCCFKSISLWHSLNRKRARLYSEHSIAQGPAFLWLCPVSMSTVLTTLMPTFYLKNSRLETVSQGTAVLSMTQTPPRRNPWPPALTGDSSPSPDTVRCDLGHVSPAQALPVPFLSCTVLLGLATPSSFPRLK